MTADNRSCRHVQEDLLLLLDGDLPERDAAYARAHLAACEACRAQMEAIAALWRAETSRPEPPSYLWTRLKARIEAGREDPAPWLPRWQDLRRAVVPAFRIAGIIAAIWLGAVIGSLSGPVDARQEVTREISAIYYLETFDTFPPGAISLVYTKPAHGSP